MELGKLLKKLKKAIKIKFLLLEDKIEKDLAKLIKMVCCGLIKKNILIL